MNKPLILTLLSIILLSSLVIAYQDESICPGADIIIPIEKTIIGENCLSNHESNFIQKVNIPFSGTHKIVAQVKRGNPNQCQINEEFFIKVNEQKSSISKDDDEACIESTRLDELGTFNFYDGENKIKFINSAPQCPPGNSANSVVIKNLCIYLSEPPVACHQDSDCGITGFIGEEFCSENNLMRNFKTSTCVNPGTTQSFCSESTVPKQILACTDKCINGECIDKPLFLEIISPEDTTYVIVAVPIEIKSNGNTIYYTIDNNPTKIPYTGPTTGTFIEGTHTLTAFATDKNNNTISDSVTFQVEIDEDFENDNDKRRPRYEPEEYFNGSGLVQDTKPIFIISGNQTQQNSDFIEISQYVKTKAPSKPTELALGAPLFLITTLLLLLFLLVILMAAVRRD